MNDFKLVDTMGYHTTCFLFFVVMSLNEVEALLTYYPFKPPGFVLIGDFILFGMFHNDISRTAFPSRDSRSIFLCKKVNFAKFNCRHQNGKRIKALNPLLRWAAFHTTKVGIQLLYPIIYMCSATLYAKRT